MGIERKGLFSYIYMKGQTPIFWVHGQKRGMILPLGVKNGYDFA